MHGVKEIGPLRALFDSLHPNEGSGTIRKLRRHSQRPTNISTSGLRDDATFLATTLAALPMRLLRARGN
jgi:hypothetical protein